jgi:hypothetical protein
MVKMRTHFLPGIAAFRHFKPAELAWIPNRLSAWQDEQDEFPWNADSEIKSRHVLPIDSALPTDLR